ncbi:hypothetical protein GGS23DRAFT_157726 [Durotheca rogersii]|uniref:uncharacterized protein n=1 Tax=Durotheca rogersii TaxID=419775 RepID=UPI00221FCE08|nr:uncharacterized protein GGS23DRAFT_157726 [Durotheca rogersii]KAI5861198.1 hypothetical protein GGS23DRAFT_157726 [Durotheca rogersii]
MLIVFFLGGGAFFWHDFAALLAAVAKQCAECTWARLDRCASRGRRRGAGAEWAGGRRGARGLFFFFFLAVRPEQRVLGYQPARLCVALSLGPYAAPPPGGKGGKERD